MWGISCNLYPAFFISIFLEFYPEEFLGENGRIKLYNNGLSYDVYQYSKNSHTAGANYEDLILVETHNKNNENERMIDAILDVIKCIEVGGQPLSNIYIQQ